MYKCAALIQGLSTRPRGRQPVRRTCPQVGRSKARASAYPLVVIDQDDSKMKNTMARNMQSTGVDAAMEMILQEGFEGLSDAVRTLINESIRIERARHIGAGPRERA